jgi:PAS domain-containing protein
VDAAIQNQDADASRTRKEALKRVVDDRAAAFARLFEAVHEGVYIGLLGPASTTTLAANPHLKLVLGYPPETIEREVRPFDAGRFADEQARTAFLDRLASAGSVADYLLRLRRADGSEHRVVAGDVTVVDGYG